MFLDEQSFSVDEGSWLPDTPAPMPNIKVPLFRKPLDILISEPILDTAQGMLEEVTTIPDLPVSEPILDTAQGMLEEVTTIPDLPVSEPILDTAQGMLEEVTTIPDLPVSEPILDTAQGMLEEVTTIPDLPVSEPILDTAQGMLEEVTTIPDLPVSEPILDTAQGMLEEVTTIPDLPVSEPILDTAQGMLEEVTTIPDLPVSEPILDTAQGMLEEVTTIPDLPVSEPILDTAQGMLEEVTTIPDLPVSEPILDTAQGMLEEVTTIPDLPAIKKSAKDTLVTQQTQPVIAHPSIQFDSNLPFVPTAHLPPLSQPSGEDDGDEFGLLTVSMSVVKDIRVKKKTTTFFAYIACWLLNLALLCGFVSVLIMLPDPIYKVEALLIFLIASSYIVSAQMKLLHRWRPKTRAFLSATQLVPAMKKESASQDDEELKHFKLIKENTTTYLRAITKTNLKKDKQQ